MLLKSLRVLSEQLLRDQGIQRIPENLQNLKPPDQAMKKGTFKAQMCGGDVSLTLQGGSKSRDEMKEIFRGRKKSMTSQLRRKGAEEWENSDKSVAKEAFVEKFLKDGMESWEKCNVCMFTGYFACYVTA